MTSLPRKIRQWAANKGVALSSALATLGVSPAVFYNWEKGGTPKPSTVYKLAGKMGVDPSEIVNSTIHRNTTDFDQRETQPLPGAGPQDVVLVAISRSAYNDMKGVLRLYHAKLVGHLTSNEVTPSLTQNQQAAA